MKRFGKRLLALLTLLPLLLLTGCIQGVQTSELALVEAVGIDRTEDGQLQLTLQIFAPRGSGSATAIDSSKNHSHRYRQHPQRSGGNCQPNAGENHVFGS